MQKSNSSMMARSITTNTLPCQPLIKFAVLGLLFLAVVPKMLAQQDLLTKELAEITNKLTDDIDQRKPITDSDLRVACNVLRRVDADVNFQSGISKIAAYNRAKYKKNNPNGKAQRNDITTNFTLFMNEFLHPETDALTKCGLSNLSISKMLTYATSVHENMELNTDDKSILESVHEFANEVCNEADETEKRAEQAKAEQAKAEQAKQAEQVKQAEQAKIINRTAVVGEGLGAVAMLLADSGVFLETAGLSAPVSGTSITVGGLFLADALGKLKDLH